MGQVKLFPLAQPDPCQLEGEYMIRRWPEPDGTWAACVSSGGWLVWSYRAEPLDVHTAQEEGLCGGEIGMLAADQALFRIIHSDRRNP